MSKLGLVCEVQDTKNMYVEVTGDSKANDLVKIQNNFYIFTILELKLFRGTKENEPVSIFFGHCPFDGSQA